MDYSNITPKQVAEAVRTFLSKQSYDGFAFHCPTKEEGELLLSALHLLGRRWSDTQPIITEDGKMFAGKKYGTKTCYRFFIEEKNVYSAQRGFYEKNSLEIIEFEDFVNEYILSKEAGTTGSAMYSAADISSDVTSAENDASESAESTGTSENDVVEISTETPQNDVFIDSETGDVYSEESLKNDDSESYVEQKQTTAGNNRKRRGNGNNVPAICKLLGLQPLKIFTVKCDNILLFYPDIEYRFNERGQREYLVDYNNDYWAPCNDEKELAYLIEHPEIIIKSE